MFRLIRRAIMLVLLVAGAALAYLYLTAQHWTGELYAPAQPDQSLPDVGWPVWGNNAAGHRFSVASQVTPANIDRLKPVWTFRTGETGEGYRSQDAHTFQATPILVGDTL